MARLPWRLVLAEMRAPTFLDSSEASHRHRDRPRRDEHPDDHEELGPRDLRTTKPRPHCWGPGRFDRHLQHIYSKLGACSLSQAAAGAWAAVGASNIQPRPGRRTGSHPLLSTTLTFEPLGSDLPAAGLSEITLPFLTCLELAFLTFPTAQ